MVVFPISEVVIISKCWSKSYLGVRHMGRAINITVIVNNWQFWRTNTLFLNIQHKQRNEQNLYRSLMGTIFILFYPHTCIKHCSSSRYWCEYSVLNSSHLGMLRLVMYVKKEKQTLWIQVWICWPCF